MTVALFLIIGLGAGVLSGLFGIGGGIVIVPALMLIGKMAPLQATGTSLGSLLLPVGALGAFEYYRRGHINIAASMWVALGLFAGAWFGAKLAHQIPQFYLKRLFAAFLVVVAARLWMTAR